MGTSFLLRRSGNSSARGVEVEGRVVQRYVVVHVGRAFGGPGWGRLCVAERFEKAIMWCWLGGVRGLGYGAGRTMTAWVTKLPTLQDNDEL